MQVTEVIKGDPYTLEMSLNFLAAMYEIQIVEKTNFAGSFVVVYDDAGSASQTALVIRGTPEDVGNELNDLIGLGNQIDILTKTFAAGFYVTVYRP